jgi:hypothetical protein
MLGFRVLCDQQLNERMKQRFASLSSVVHKLEKTEVQGEFRAQLRVRGLGQDEQGIKASVDPGESQV